MRSLKFRAPEAQKTSYYFLIRQQTGSIFPSIRTCDYQLPPTGAPSPCVLCVQGEALHTLHREWRMCQGFSSSLGMFTSVIHSHHQLKSELFVKKRVFIQPQPFSTLEKYCKRHRCKSTLISNDVLEIWDQMFTLTVAANKERNIAIP